MVETLRLKLQTFNKQFSPWFKGVCIGVGGVTLFMIIYHALCCGGDFEIYMVAADYISRGKLPYGHITLTLSDGTTIGHGKFRYSPWAATLFVPFTFLPLRVAFFIWLTLGTVFIFYTCRLLLYFLPTQALSFEHKVGLLLLALLGVIRFIGQNYELGQMTLFLVWASLLSLYWIQRGKTVRGSALLGMAINIKVMPITLLPYLLYRKAFKPAILTIGFVVVFLLLPTLFYGLEQNLILHQAWWEVIRPVNEEYLLETKAGIYDLSAFVPALLTDLPGETHIDLPRHFVSLAPSVISVITLIVKGIFIVFTLYFIRDWPFTPFKKREQTLWEVSYIFMITPLIFPHQPKYEFYYLLPGLSYLVFYMYHMRQGRTGFSCNTYYVLFGGLSLYILLTQLTSVNIVDRYWYNVSQYYNVITYGVFILMGVLAYCRPVYLRNKYRQSSL